MPEPRFICSLIVQVLALAGCTSASLPLLPSAPAPAAQNAGKTEAGETPIEVVSIVPGTPTEIYALVARGALRCWFGTDGPLKPTHVFHAEAHSPAEGGAAEMVLHERDEALRDKRGARAFRVSFSAEAAGVRVAVSIPKMEQQLALVMAKDVEGWAKGGTDCGLRRHIPPSLTPVIGRQGR